MNTVGSKQGRQKASFWFGEHRRGDDALGEAHALAESYGDADAAPAIYLAVGACEPEVGAGFAVSSYPCTYSAHYSGYAERRWGADRAALLDGKLKQVAERAFPYAQRIRETHRELFADAGAMNTEQRFAAAQVFRARVRELLQFHAHRLPETGGK